MKDILFILLLGIGFCILVLFINWCEKQIDSEKF